MGEINLRTNVQWKWIISAIYIIALVSSLFLKRIEYFLISTTLFNLLAFIVFGYDKRNAKNGRWRVPEALFLLWSFFGAAIGILMGMRVFRHKTLHRSFQIFIPLLSLWNIAWFYLLIMEINK